MSDRYTVTVDPEGVPAVMGPFRELARARYRARGSVTVDHGGGPDDIVVEVGLGEGDSGRAVLRMDRPGRFEIPEVIPRQELVSFRCGGLRPHTPVTITLELEPEGEARRSR